jgi:hypothetical protein
LPFREPVDVDRHPVSRSVDASVPPKDNGPPLGWRLNRRPLPQAISSP